MPSDTATPGRKHYWLSPDQERLADRVTPLDKYGCFHVESLSRPDTFHMVEMDDRTGITTCDCEAGYFGGGKHTCWHRRAVHWYLTRLLGRPV